MVTVTVVGAGKVGTEVAKHILLNDLADVVLIDIDGSKARGEALDLAHMVAILGIDRDIIASTRYEDMSGSDVVVICAGIPRRHGMTREQLISVNASTVFTIAKAIATYCPNAVTIVVTNPVDALTYVVWKATGFERRRIIGFGSILDSARLRYILAKRFNVSISRVTALVMGEHGEAMVPLFRFCYVDGKPVTELVPAEELEMIKEEVRKCGETIIKLRGYSSNHAPGAGIAMLVRAVLKDEKKVYPVSAILDGEYGFKGVPLSVPAVIGREGVEKIIELPLNADERRLIVLALRKIIDTLRCALPQELCPDVSVLSTFEIDT